MKKTMNVSVAIAVLGLSAHAVFANEVDTEKATCSLASLHGTYAWGYAATDNGEPYSTSGRESYDGKGSFKWYQLYNSGGVSPAVYSGTGTYTITADCVASVVYDGFHGNTPYTYFVIPDGDGYFWNNNFSEGTVSGGRVTRITKALLVH